jgi:hypothetical protein
MQRWLSDPPNCVFADLLSLAVSEQMAVVLSVAGVSAEAEFERIRRVFMGLNWLWPKHFVDKVVELKTPAAYADWLAHNKTTFGAGAASHAATSPLVWLNANQYFPTFSALLAHLRPPFAEAV